MAAERKIGVHRQFALNQALQMVLENLATDPAGAALVGGRVWWNTAEGRAKAFDGTAIKTVAWLSDLANIGSLIGGWDASGDTLPVAANDGRDDPTTVAADKVIMPGDRFYITNASTAALGLAGGDRVLEDGDLLVALTQNPAAPGDWIALQSNISMGAVVSREIINVASLPAATPTALSFPALSVVDIVAIKEDLTGDVIDLCVDGLGTGTVTIESNIALGALTIMGHGLAA